MLDRLFKSFYSEIFFYEKKKDKKKSNKLKFLIINYLFINLKTNEKKLKQKKNAELIIFSLPSLFSSVILLNFFFIEMYIFLS